MSLDLEKQLVFYGSYHHNSVNVAIHIICVPAILLTGLLLATNSPTIDLPTYLSIPNFPINLGTTAAILYCFLYVLMEPVAGLGVAPIILGSTAYFSHLLSVYGSVVTHWAIAVHVVSWIAQFIGHGHFEGRAPALLDNLVQALFLAPFFVWFEVLFYFGYRPKLKARLDKQIQKEVQKFRASKSQTWVDADGANDGATSVRL